MQLKQRNTSNAIVQENEKTMQQCKQNAVK